MFAKELSAAAALDHEEDAAAHDRAREAAAAVHVGIWVSAIRCILTYVVAPALGALGLVLGPFGLVLQLLGAVTATAGAHRLRRLRHRGWIAYAVVALVIDVLTVVSIVTRLEGGAR